MHILQRRSFIIPSSSNSVAILHGFLTPLSCLILSPSPMSPKTPSRSSPLSTDWTDFISPHPHCITASWRPPNAARGSAHLALSWRSFAWTNPRWWSDAPPPQGSPWASARRRRVPDRSLCRVSRCSVGALHDELVFSGGHDPEFELSDQDGL